MGCAETLSLVSTWRRTTAYILGVGSFSPLGGESLRSGGSVKIPEVLTSLANWMADCGKSLINTQLFSGENPVQQSVHQTLPPDALYRISPPRSHRYFPNTHWRRSRIVVKFFKDRLGNCLSRLNFLKYPRNLFCGREVIRSHFNRIKYCVDALSARHSKFYKLVKVALAVSLKTILNLHLQGFRLFRAD